MWSSREFWPKWGSSSGGQRSECREWAVPEVVATMRMRMRTALRCRPLPQLSMVAILLRASKVVAARLARRHLLAFQQTFRSANTVSYPLQLSSVTENHAAIYEESLNNAESFWGHLARSRLRWFKEFDQVMDCNMKEGRLSWFNGGKINVSGNL